MPVGEAKISDRHQIKRRCAKCREKTEQAREARARERAEVWEEAVVDEAHGVVEKGKEEVLQQAREVIAFVPAAVKEPSINWGAPVMTRNAQSAARP